MKETKQYTCATCFSTDLQWRAFVSWDYIAQEMVIDDIGEDLDNEAYCFDCSQDVEIETTTIVHRIIGEY
jgi:hypothetical protein|tara:strand:+ start:1641 stop:1850 length:210 start_codon:yes stop_codon:yes gene_type:complete